MRTLVDVVRPANKQPSNCPRLFLPADQNETQQISPQNPLHPLLPFSIKKVSG